MLGTCKFIKCLQILSQMLVKIDATKNGNDLPKNPKLVPLQRKNFTRASVPISISNIVFKREQEKLNYKMSFPLF